MKKRFTRVLPFAMSISLAGQAAAQGAPAANKPNTDAKAPSTPAAESPAPATPGSGTTTEPLPETPSTGAASSAEGGASKDAVQTTSVAAAKKAPATPATPPDQSDSAAKDVDVDLESDESGGETQSDSSLHFYGFADFSAMYLLHPEDSLQANFIDPRQSFSVGRFNLYMAKQIAPKWNFLAEVRYMYLPN